MPAAESEAKWIVLQASGLDDEPWLSVLEALATKRGVASFDSMLARRESGEPVQYVLGRWAFRRLDLMVDRRVLIPRPETEVVAEVALEELDRLAAPGLTMTAVDLGTGSGALGLSLAIERTDTEVILTDVSAGALEVASANLTGLGRAATRVRILQGSWFSALPPSRRGEIHLIVSNPPYVAAGEDLPASVRDWEPIQALVAGPAGTEALEEVLAGSREWLAPGGAVVVELAPHQMEATTERATDLGYDHLRVVADLAGRERVLVARS